MLSTVAFANLFSPRRAIVAASMANSAMAFTGAKPRRFAQALEITGITNAFAKRIEPTPMKMVPVMAFTAEMTSSTPKESGMTSGLFSSVSWSQVMYAESSKRAVASARRREFTSMTSFLYLS